MIMGGMVRLVLRGRLRGVTVPGADLEALLLGSAATLTRQDIDARSGVPTEVALDVWTAMGFAEIPEDVQAFTEADLEALTTAASLLDLGVIDLDALLVMARAMGQGMARLAEAHIDVLRGVTADLGADEALSTMTSRADVVLPKLDALVLFVWRRQFAAAVHRTLASTLQDGMPVLAIGFLDLVDFTRSTRRWDAAQLEQTLERFERDTALRVAAVGGRVVKTLGDGVLFTTDAAQTAVRVALDTVAAHDADEELPAVRGGVALGPVLVRLGDVFGEPVNIASRLSEQARAGSVLVDKHVVDALPTGFEITHLQKRSVRGYRSLTPYRVKPRTS
jgi:adenylate cyclase